jgi:hypothetical protein
MDSGDERKERDEDEDVHESEIPGTFLTGELEAATARFLADVRRIVRRRISGEDEET